MFIKRNLPINYELFLNSCLDDFWRFVPISFQFTSVNEFDVTICRYNNCFLIYFLFALENDNNKFEMKKKIFRLGKFKV